MYVTRAEGTRLRLLLWIDTRMFQRVRSRREKDKKRVIHKERGGETERAGERQTPERESFLACGRVHFRAWVRVLAKTSHFKEDLRKAR